RLGRLRSAQFRFLAHALGELRYDVSQMPACEPSRVELLPWLWRTAELDLLLMQNGAASGVPVLQQMRNADHRCGDCCRVPRTFAGGVYPQASRREDPVVQSCPRR